MNDAPVSRAAAPGDPASVVVILPTYREAANLEEVLGGIRTALPDAEILVVDDDGGDGTADLADKIAEKLGRISVLRQPAKGGLGKAYLAGFAWGLDHGYDVLVGMDADLSHPPSVLPRLVGAVAAGADVAVGSRYVPGGATVNWSLLRRALSRGGNLYASGVLSTGVADMTSAFRAYRADALRSIDLTALHAHGYGFMVELLYRLRRRGASVTEVPIVFADRVRGTSKMTPDIAVEAFRVVTRIAVTERPRRHPVVGRAHPPQPRLADTATTSDVP